jgi:hypothetical protein
MPAKSAKYKNISVPENAYNVFQETRQKLSAKGLFAVPKEIVSSLETKDLSVGAVLELACRSLVFVLEKRQGQR